ncbi:hypothetical protein [Burkholderia gladioli]|uniref:hypothetical protein n=1 Tax=Burkholderia gladioli TaxID=28095 RepID=UPI0016569285|nr:hypothetical protein [Burkholderia gladioli]
MNNRPLVIYHGNCADGFSGAWCFWRKYGDQADYVAASYQKDPPDVAGRVVYLVDFSYKRDVVAQLLELAESVTLIDHHKTALEDLAGLPGLVTFTDLERSGATLAWDFLFPTEPRPLLLGHVEDRDLWRFKLAGTREIQAFVFSQEYSFGMWDKLMAADQAELIKMTAAGAAIERKHHKDVAELVRTCKRTMNIAGHDVPVASLPYTMSSDAGHLMAQGQPFAACYWDTPSGRTFSLRSTDVGLDVAEIAAVYGGGGHKHAAGFTVAADHSLATHAGNPSTPYLTAYEYDTAFGVHREFYPTTWNGQRPTRTVQLHRLCAGPVVEAALEAPEGEDPMAEGQYGTDAGLKRLRAAYCVQQPAPADERAAFERELVKRIPTANLVLRDADEEYRPGQYEHASHEFAWQFWQARASQAAAPADVQGGQKFNMRTALSTAKLRIEQRSKDEQHGEYWSAAQSILAVMKLLDDMPEFFADVAAAPAEAALLNRVSQLEKALVYVGHRLHDTPQYMLCDGVALIDNDGIKVKARDIDVAVSLRGDTQPVRGDAPTNPFPYQKTFNAIAAATSIVGGHVSISVKAFQDAFGAAPADAREPSPTVGMNLGERIKHVGGRENAAGYIEFGSVAAVDALIKQVIRDLPRPSPSDAIDTALLREALDDQCAFQAEIDRLRKIINTPQSGNFLRAVSIEAEHQRQRWSSKHDSGKMPADWFWLVSYLAGKALHAHAVCDEKKAEHHIITTAAALANWHLAIFGKSDMRPGTEQPGVQGAQGGTGGDRD